MKEQRHQRLEPHIAQPLEDQGLLHILEPEKLVDGDATERLFAAVTHLLDSGQLEDLAKDKESMLHGISYSRVGGYGNSKLADEMIKRLKKHGLAADSRDGVSVPMHPIVRQVILALLSQILRSQGRGIGLDLAPVTDDVRFTGALEELLRVRGAHSAGHVVAADLETIGVDLSNVPLDEVLDFKRQHGDAFRRYTRSVRRFVREVSALDPVDRKQAEEERRVELRELAQAAKAVARKSWAKPTTFALGASGAAWKLGTGDVVGAALGVGAALLAISAGRSPETGAFSYLFSLPRRPYA